MLVCGQSLDPKALHLGIFKVLSISSSNSKVITILVERRFPVTVSTFVSLSVRGSLFVVPIG